MVPYVTLDSHAGVATEEINDVSQRIRILTWLEADQVYWSHHNCNNCGRKKEEAARVVKLAMAITNRM